MLHVGQIKDRQFSLPFSSGKTRVDSRVLITGSSMERGPPNITPKQYKKESMVTTERSKIAETNRADYEK